MTDSSGADKQVASITFGIFIGLIVFTIVKALRQTWGIWSRTKNAWNRYLWMMWVEVLVNLVFAITTYMYIDGIIKGR
jgi:xanthine/uracil/vitamin C permease (AzgA family)